MRTDRLLQLADHLEHGKLGHEVFDFTEYNSSPNNRIGPHCGTSGCAIGECPILWPQDWQFNNLAFPVLSVYDKESDNKPKESAVEWFEITLTQYLNLFVPKNDDMLGRRDLSRLPGSATKEQVAAHIREFVGRYLKQE